MSHFYADIQGARGEATRTGTKSSGITAHARGWDIGGKVECYFDECTGEDVVVFYLTKGSNGYSEKEIARATNKGMRYADAKVQLVNKVESINKDESAQGVEV